MHIASEEEWLKQKMQKFQGELTIREVMISPLSVSVEELPGTLENWRTRKDSNSEGLFNFPIMRERETESRRMEGNEGAARNYLASFSTILWFPSPSIYSVVTVIIRLRSTWARWSLPTSRTGWLMNTARTDPLRLCVDLVRLHGNRILDFVWLVCRHFFFSPEVILAGCRAVPHSEKKKNSF